jgi:cell division protein FtsI (penicillin-binding protein 3)
MPVLADFDFESSSPGFASRARGSMLLSLLLIFIGTLAARLVQIQYLSGDGFATTALQQHGRFERLPARPGDILDSRGRPMATSVETPSVFVDPKAIDPEKRADVAESLAMTLGIDREPLERRLEKYAKRRFLWVKRRVSDDEARAVRDLKWPAHWVAIQPEMRRFYPQGPVASHVLGIRDIDGKPRDGIERVFNPVLAGKPGRRVLARDARGKTLAVADHLSVVPEPGASVVLTVDSVIQNFAEEAIDRVMSEWKPTSATAIVMDPHTGEVLALTNRPTFDPEDSASAAPEAWVNRAVSDTYEPGSTFKPFIVASALDWEVVVPSDQIDCHNGAYRMGPRLLHSHHHNGLLTVPEIVVRSDNIGMAIIGERMTNPGLYRAVQSFGFGRPTGIELPGESSGTVRPLKQWTPFYSTGSVPMGHELSVTPMQLITAFSALANGGSLVRPRLVRAIVQPDGRRVQLFEEPEVVGQPVRGQTAKFMVEEVLTGVVDRGTGRKAQVSGYSVFGKTGTAQKQSEHGGYVHGQYLSSFMAGAPADNPRIVVLVVADNPTKGGGEPFGGKVAAPAVAEILRRSLVYLGVPPDRTVLAKGKDREPFHFTD